MNHAQACRATEARRGSGLGVAVGRLARAERSRQRRSDALSARADLDDERVAGLIKTTLHTKPANGSTHWSVRSVAAETGISKSSVQRYFQLSGLQPHRSESFKLSNGSVLRREAARRGGPVPAPA